MKISLVPVGIMKRFINDPELEIQGDLTQEELIQMLGLPDELKIVCFINGKRTDKDHKFREGDVVKIVSALAGG